MPPVLGDFGLQVGQLGHLKASRFGVFGARFVRQRRVAALTVRGNKGYGLSNLLRRQQLLKMRRMPGLSARLTAAGFLGGGAVSAAADRGATLGKSLS